MKAGFTMKTNRTSTLETATNSEPPVNLEQFKARLLSELAPIRAAKKSEEAERVLRRTADGMEMVERTTIVMRPPGAAKGSVYLEETAEDLAKNITAIGEEPCYCDRCVHFRLEDIVDATIGRALHDQEIPSREDFEAFRRSVMDLARRNRNGRATRNEYERQS